MKKILVMLLAIQLMVALTACCCPCAKKIHEQKPAEESTPAPSEEKPAN